MLRQRITSAITVLAGLVVAVASVSAAEPDTTKVTSQDKRFLEQAAKSGIAEVTLGQLAVERASSQAVKDLGQRMIDDHTKANEELKRLAASEGVVLPKTMDRENQATVKRLSKLSGTEFDRAFIQATAKNHKKDVATFQRQAQKGKDPEVKSWATNTRPTLEQHLHSVQDTATQFGLKKSPR